MHTNHTRKTDDESHLTKDVSDHYSKLTERDWQQAARLLGLLKLKVKYRKYDLWRDIRSIQDEEVTYLDEMGEHLEEAPVVYENLNQDWAFLLEDGDLIEAIQKLSVRQKDIIWKLYAEGKSQQEIADEVTLSTAAISKTKKRAFKRIRQYLKGE